VRKEALGKHGERKAGFRQKLDKIGLKEIYKGKKCIRTGGGFKG